MRIRELIDALTKFETVSGPDAETTIVSAELCSKTSLSFENRYGYSRSTEQIRKPIYWVAFDTQKLYDMSEQKDPRVITT